MISPVAFAADKALLGSLAAGAAALVVAAVAPAGPGVAPGPCKASQTRAVAYAFARAWTRGDLAAVERLVAREPQYRWVSAGPPGGRSGPRAFDRRSLSTFIRTRHAQQESLRLRSFKFNGSDVRAGDGYGHFEFIAYRDANDWPQSLSHTRRGKGAIVCTLVRPMLAVWSLG